MLNELSKDINNIRNQAQRVIIDPYNVLSIDNPDELLLIEDMLVGIFYPTKTEINNPKRLLRRILNSKLTYARTLKTVLFSKEDCPVLYDRTITSSVDTFIHVGEADRLIRRLRNPQMDVVTFSSKTRMQTFRNFGRNIRLYSFLHDKRRKYEPISLKENPCMVYDGKRMPLRNFHIRKISLGNSYGNLILNNYDGKFISSSRSLQSFFTEALFLKFAIEGKDILPRYFTTHDYSFLNSSLTELDEEDLIKICFAGFIPICASSEAECIDFITTYNNEKRSKRY